MKFKVGDRVKIVKAKCYSKEKFIGKIYEIIDNDKLKFETQEWWKLNDGSIWRWCEDELELVEEPIESTEVKIDSNEITITAKPLKLIIDDLNNSYTIHDTIIDKNKQLYDWWQALDKEKMLPGQDKFNIMFKGIWNKEMKEGNEMIESMNLIDLYASKHKESIEKETKEKVEELRKNCDIINKFNELVEQFKKDCDELYLSQFTEEEKNKIVLNREIDDSDMQLRRNSGYLYNYVVNKDFKSAEYYDTMNERNKKLAEIDDLVKTVKAHVGIAKTKEEVEEILTRYGIIDKKGKLVTK